MIACACGLETKLIVIPERPNATLKCIRIVALGCWHGCWHVRGATETFSPSDDSSFPQPGDYGTGTAVPVLEQK